MNSLERGGYTWGSTYSIRSPLMNGDNSSPPTLYLANIIFDLSFKCLKPRRNDDMALLATVAGRSFIRFVSDCLDPPLLILVSSIS